MDNILIYDYFATKLENFQILEQADGVQFGLAKGSSDLIGFKTIKVTPEMIGQDLAVFCSVEVKTNTGQLSEYQHNWLQAVKSAGGIVGVARNVRDALEILKVS